mmetsp:Transcript_98464/g.307187  ORF Transcript_98464/g.307187 Transcript_98464/m.307187 type:complete len:533 (+) Transcript_98464:1-1599(+)
MVKERYAAGATIFRELSSGSSIFFLLSGEVELTITTPYVEMLSPRGADGTVINLEEASKGQAATATGWQRPTAAEHAAEEVRDLFRLGPNDIFGEMTLFTSETVQAKAVAVSPSCVLRIPRGALHRLLASNRRLQDFVAMTAVDRLRETDVFCRCTPSTVARLVSFMSQAEFEAGDVLFYDVDSLCPVYFVVLGRVEVVRGGLAAGADPGARHVVCANGLLGTEHLVLGTAAHATATALERTTVLIVKRSDIDKLCEKDERFRQAILASTPGGVSSAIELNPPEGTAAPAKFGCTALEELGWQRQVTPSMPEERTGTPCVATPTPSEPPDEDERHGEDTGGLLAQQDTLLAVEADLPDLLANHDAAAAGKDAHAGHGGGRGAQAAIMIWLGILIDGVPESVVMGILVNSASQGTLLAFVVGVFLANFPEAMSSAGTMRLHGMRKRVIMLMWSSITVMTGFGAMVGATIFPPGSKEDPSIQKVIAAIEGLCGGAMLCMIANTVLPEAFEQGGNVTGLSTLLGFIVAVTVSVSQ